VFVVVTGMVSEALPPWPSVDREVEGVGLRLCRGVEGGRAGVNVRLRNRAAGAANDRPGVGEGTAVGVVGGGCEGGVVAGVDRADGGGAVNDRVDVGDEDGLGGAVGVAVTVGDGEVAW